MAATKEVHETSAVDLGDLLDAGDAAMVTLLAGEARLAVHRAVLAARSPVFAAMFQHDTVEARNGEVTITDVDGPVLRQLLAYCYTLKVPQLPGMAGQLLAAADKYGLSALKDACEQQLAGQLTAETAAATAILAVRHSCPSLAAAALPLMRPHLVRVMTSQSWVDAALTCPKVIVEVSQLLIEQPAETGKPTSATPGTHCQPHSSHSRLTPVTAATTMASHHNSPPDRAFVGFIWGLSVEERAKRLNRAVTQGAVQELRALLAVGADVGARDWQGWTVLHYAAYWGHEEVARCLLEGGAEVDARSNGHSTPLHWAAVSGHAAVARLLLAASADPNARNQGGRTPLHCAARHGRAVAAAVLLLGGADWTATDDEGRTPLDIAQQYNQQELIEMLTQRCLTKGNKN